MVDVAATTWPYPVASEKAPTETVDYQLDWSGWLATGESISQATVIATGVTLVQSSFTATTATAQVSGGTAGLLGTIQFRITTDSTPVNRVDDRTLILRIAGSSGTTLLDLIAAFRTEADDLVAPYLWSDAEIASYLADAETEACIRARLLIDETTANVAEIAIVANAWVTLDASVLDVVRARLASAPDVPLEQCPPDVLDQVWAGWETQTGTPLQYYVQGGRLRLVPQPTAASDTLYLTVYRTPLVPLSTSNLAQTPEIPAIHHLRLLDWALARAYAKRDADSFEAGRAELHRQRFDAHFGPRPSGSAIRQQLERGRHVVRSILF